MGRVLLNEMLLEIKMINIWERLCKKEGNNILMNYLKTCIFNIIY